ncbi:MAG: N-succinylarginine dihydrolase [Proteobacteria bacterium]|nr:N-succinylarginine dihydrolase [Pseudomonadota bacterium]
MSTFEVNFDGLVGPTHNYAGLSYGNVASSEHSGLVASPRKAALQGLDKMLALHRLGLQQAVLPPHERPHLPTLHKMGFKARKPAAVLQRVFKQDPQLLAGVCSASAMWVANAATVSPFADTADGKTHFTPANLSSMFHRAIEVQTTAAVLAAIFQGEDYLHHAALSADPQCADEGAANHTRFCTDYGEPGVELFVYGRSAQAELLLPKEFPARQTFEASKEIAGNHGLSAARTVFAQQNPAAIDAGVFHNDVIAVGNRNLLFYHQLAFANTTELRQQLDRGFGNDELNYIEVPSDDVSLEDAVASYLFNSQLLSTPGKPGHTLIVPAECQETVSVSRYLQQLEADNELIDQVLPFDLRQSMNNGGGPACLRLRVVMNTQQLAGLQARVILNDELHSRLRNWINKHYRDRLAPDDLRDPSLLLESLTALDELTGILNLSSIYEFQK